MDYEKNLCVIEIGLIVHIIYCITTCYNMYIVHNLYDYTFFQNDLLLYHENSWL